MLGTKLCDRCWELEGRILRDLELAKKIIAAQKPDPATNSRYATALEVYHQFTKDTGLNSPNFDNWLNKQRLNADEPHCA